MTIFVPPQPFLALPIACPLARVAGAPIVVVSVPVPKASTASAKPREDAYDTHADAKESHEDSEGSQENAEALALPTTGIEPAEKPQRRTSERLSKVCRG